jgi:hypothetical protein
MEASLSFQPASLQEPARVVRRIERLDDLVFLENDEMRLLYEAAPAPAIRDLDGPLRGRMLAVPALPDVVTALPRAWARTRSFPWRGKTFRPTSDVAGVGKNRVVSERVSLFPFTTAIAPSRHDGKPALELDYDHAGNPGFIRRIEDEVRTIAPGLLLGQAWLRTGRTKHSNGSCLFVLWFALESRARG